MGVHGSEAGEKADVGQDTSRVPASRSHPSLLMHVTDLIAIDNDDLALLHRFQ